MAIGLGITVAAVALGAMFHEPLILAALRPGLSFAESPIPSPADYAELAAWTAHPELEDESDVVPPGLAAAGDDAAADVFYVHPTSYLGSRWNGPIDDPALNASTDRLSTRIQATAASCSG